jgi:hypothetical protein
MDARHRLLGISAVLGATVGVVLVYAWRPALAAPNEISVGGVWVCNITQGASGYSADQRVAAIRQRITNVLSTNGFRDNPNVFVRVRGVGPDAQVWVGDPQQQILVFTVTPADSAGTSLTPVQVADQWAPRLAQGLGKAMPSSKWNIPGHVYLF